MRLQISNESEELDFTFDRHKIKSTMVNILLCLTVCAFHKFTIFLVIFPWASSFIVLIASPLKYTRVLFYSSFFTWDLALGKRAG